LDVNLARIFIAGLSGDSGKTIVSLCLLAALRRKALSLSVFKKGPDYIDPAWLSTVAGVECRNLDTYLVTPDRARDRFLQHARSSDLAVIEGNRGLFDGKDVSGTHSSAALAKLLKTPVVLVVDCTKTTRTIAAMILGCMNFDPELNIVGVILNRIAGKRHLKIVSDSIREYCRLPILGALPKLQSDQELIPGRHLGLVPPSEFEAADKLVDRLAELAAEHLDADAILELARNSEALTGQPSQQQAVAAGRVRIGCFRDQVFTFYYPENLEALETAGAELVPISSLADAKLPDIDALYIGGGFPETFAERLAANRSMLVSVRAAGEAGLPIYAECGGLIYLSKKVIWRQKSHELAALLPIDLELSQRPVGHGYTEAQVDRDNPYFEAGQVIRGHEFHYSAVVPNPTAQQFCRANSCLAMNTGVGVGQKRDGLLYKATFAAYTHIHADGVPGWAENLVGKAAKHRDAARGNPGTDSGH
jgi:cobyrinic acid a,c-diamide synthase